MKKKKKKREPVKEKKVFVCCLFVRIKGEQNRKEPTIGRMNRCETDANVVLLLLLLLHLKFSIFLMDMFSPHTDQNGHHQKIYKQ